MINLFYMLATNKPMKFGVYQTYYFDEAKELFAHYEEDLKSAIRLANGKHLSRMAQALYIMKVSDYETLWWRIEE
jgi:hypothetical protein